MFSNSTDSTADIPYIGRFAPSPTGPLHFGSLLAALASFLDAKSHQGTWLVRIEDIDPPREQPSAKTLILQALDVYGLHSDQAIVFQSQRDALYQDALERLIQQQRVFACCCSRKQLADNNGIHFGACRSVNKEVEQGLSSFAWRLDSQPFHRPLHTAQIEFFDQLQGLYSQSVKNDIGDFVVKRKDQLWAYQLAMVVDDYQQGVTHVVRGIDLIDSTLRQNMLQMALGYPQPHYAHIPVACADNGQKLSKQNLAPALDLENPQISLWRALSWLRQEPPEILRHASVKELLAWGIAHWNAEKLAGIKQQAAF